jgi:magnesium-transporting ATPase (P-type)
MVPSFQQQDENQAEDQRSARLPSHVLGIAHNSVGTKKKVILTVTEADGITIGRHRTLISRQWHVMLPLFFILFVTIGAIVGYQNKICPLGAEPFSSDTHTANIIVASCFTLLFVHNIISMSFFFSSNQKDMQHPRSVYGAAATITLIAGISNIISLTSSGSRHICEDALGIETYHSQWADWMVTVPLMGYVALAIEDKRRLDQGR